MGRSAALNAPVRHIARLENAPAVGFISKARAVPIPWAVMPKQKPQIFGSSIFNSRNTNGARQMLIAAVKATQPAAKVVRPPEAFPLPSSSANVQFGCEQTPF